MQLEEEEGCCNLDLAELLYIEEEEEHWLANEAYVNVCLLDKLLYNKNTRWLCECGWLRWFVHRLLNVIAATSQLPSHKHQALYLGL
jgi:hypothetical protein